MKREKMEAAKRGERVFKELATDDALKKSKIVSQGIESA